MGCFARAVGFVKFIPSGSFINPMEPLNSPVRSDLHVHSEFSNDGELGVEDIVRKCIESEIRTLSITDHNCVRGIHKAVTLCSRSGIDFIPGIEIDCIYQDIDLHVLGYQIDWESQEFIDLEENVEKRIMDSVPQMIENLAKEGIAVDVDEVMEKSRGKAPSAELFAEVLLAKKENRSNIKLRPYLEGGARSDMPYINFYLDFFAQGKPAYVEVQYMSYPEAIALIKSKGGIPIIAHPGQNLRGKENRVLELLELGAEGLEVFNNYHDDKQIEYFAMITLQRGALMTCGSDFHGKTKPLIHLGEFAFNRKYETDLKKSLIRILHR